MLRGNALRQTICIALLILILAAVAIIVGQKYVLASDDKAREAERERLYKNLMMEENVGLMEWADEETGLTVTVLERTLGIEGGRETGHAIERLFINDQEVELHQSLRQLTPYIEKLLGAADCETVIRQFCTENAIDYENTMIADLESDTIYDLCELIDVR
ncbi:MAG: hypothetical protein Q4C25_04965 [Bacillota bacterium]|nr:hypothetical protein [Bacillota bacterium]